MPTLTSRLAIDPITADSVLYIVDGDGNSRKVTAADLAQWIITEESIVPASEPFRGALVRRTSNLSITSNTNTAIPWQDSDYDTDSIWSGGAPTRMTVPPGVTKVRVGFGARVTGGAVDLFSFIARNGDTSDTPAMHNANSAFSFGHAVIWTHVMEVEDGDYFEAYLHLSAGLTFPAHVANWCAMEIVEVQP